MTHVGEIIAKEVTLDEESIRVFALLCGDNNPLHHDRSYAEKSRFGSLIASGPHYSALLMGLAATHFSATSAEMLGLEFHLRLKEAVRAGETVRLCWRVAEITPKPSLGGDILTLEGTITNGKGEEVLACLGKILVSEKSPPDE